LYKFNPPLVRKVLVPGEKPVAPQRRKTAHRPG
jgi:hypothetical protein